MKKLITMCGSLLLISPVSLLAANSVYISCPVDSLRTEVVTKVPKEWWATPQIGDLVDVRIDTVGGQKTLACAYRAFGGTATLMRRLPSGFMSCQVQGNGFHCANDLGYMPSPREPAKEVNIEDTEMRDRFLPRDQR